MKEGNIFGYSFNDINDMQQKRYAPKVIEGAATWTVMCPRCAKYFRPGEWKKSGHVKTVSCTLCGHETTLNEARARGWPYLPPSVTADEWRDCAEKLADRLSSIDPSCPEVARFDELNQRD